MRTFIVLAAATAARPETAYAIPARGFRQIRETFKALKSERPDLFGDIIAIDEIEPEPDYDDRTPEDIFRSKGWVR